MPMSVSMCHINEDWSGLGVFHFQCSLEEIQQQNPRMYDNKVCRTMNQKLPTLSHKFQ